MNIGNSQQSNSHAGYDNIEETLPPHDTEAEAAVLGSLLIDPDAYYEVAEAIDAAMFYQPRNGWLYDAIHDLQTRGEQVDLVTVSDALRNTGHYDDIGGLEYLMTVVNAVPTSLNAVYYASIVAEKATRRRLIRAGGDVAKAAYNDTLPVADVVTAAESAIFGVSRQAGQVTLLPPRRYMSDYVDNFLRDITAGPATDRVIATGLIDLDAMLGGLERGHQYMVAGRTSMGKSSLALGVALHALRQDKTVAIFSLEMTHEQIVNRLISMMTRIPGQRLKPQFRYQLTEVERTTVLEAGGWLSDGRLHLDCTPGLTPSDIRARAGRAQVAHGLDMVIVDHMPIARPSVFTGNRVKDLGAIAIELADIYKSLDVVGLTLAQLNRGVDARAIKRPVLSDLRESGQIEEAAYIVLFVHREAYYDDTAPAGAAEIIIAKNRDGATGTVSVYWQADRAHFVNAQQVQL